MKTNKIAAFMTAAVFAATSTISAFAAVSPIGSDTTPLSSFAGGGTDGTANSDAEYTFKLAKDTSKTFVMLDENEEGDMFVVTKDGYGRKSAVGTPTTYETYVEDGVTKINYDDPNQLLHWLANDFLANGYDFNGVNYKLPDGIINNLKTVNWQFEPVTLGSGIAIPQEGMDAKVSFLSLTEYNKYKYIVGYDDGMDSSVEEGNPNGYGGWHTRTLIDGSYTDSRVFIARYAAAWGWGGGTAFAIRPCFYLDKGFVLNAKVDVESLGSHVKDYIKAKYSRDQLAAAGYSTEEITAILGAEVIDPDPEPEVRVSPIGSDTTPLTPFENGGTDGIANSDAEYTFKLASNASKTFVMLDENEDGDMFVVTKDSYGRKSAVGTPTTYETYISDGTMKIKYDDPNQMLYWLANDFLTNGYDYNGVNYKLPDEIINNLKTINWQFEPVTLGTGAAIPQEGMEAKVSVLSLTEYNKYKYIVGYDDGIDSSVEEGNPNGWGGCHTRTLTNGSYTDSRVFIARTGAAWGWGGGTAFAIRPCFYLDKDFVLNAKVDVESLGSHVKDYIKAKYSRDQLLAADYSVEEITAILGAEVIDPEPESEVRVSPIGSDTNALSTFDNGGIAGVANSNRDYTFKLANNTDKTFVMLDKNEDGDIFVVTKDGYGRRSACGTPNTYETYVENGTMKIKYDDPNQMLYWLANDFLANGYDYNGVNYKLPDEIINNLKTINWQFEPVNMGTGAAVPQEGMEAKVSVLSLTEYNKYSSIVGYDDGIDSSVEDGNPNGWGGCHTRTLTNGSYTDTRAFISRQSASWGYGGAAAFAIRPCFYLDKDFVLNTKLDVDSLGSKVKEFIRENYDRDEFAKLGYTDDEVTAVFGQQSAKVTFGFKDAENNAVTGLTGGAAVKGVYSVKNLIDTPITAMAVIASYDKTTGKLLSVNYTGTAVTINSQDTAEVESATITLPSDVSNVLVKSFIWEGFSTMQPLSNTVNTLSIQ